MIDDECKLMISTNQVEGRKVAASLHNDVAICHLRPLLIIISNATVLSTYYTNYRTCHFVTNTFAEYIYCYTPYYSGYYYW